ncbi:MAG: superfamily I DNA/RNA helicase [bacterium]|jgi:superfamily I DNA/RNA helicase
MSKIDLSSLNLQQRLAVETVDLPVLVLSGAGSGKTRVITTRIAYLISNRYVPANKILALTFTNKASKEMRERVVEQLGKKSKGVTISTFHALCVQILREYIDLLGYRKNFIIYDTSDQQALIKSIIEDNEIDDLDIFTFKDAHFEILQAKGKGVPPAFFLSQKENLHAQLLGKVYEEYNRMLKGCNAIDFEDILQLAMVLLEEHLDDVEPLISKYEYILVDEYQDTNQIQYKFVKILIAHTRKLCVVGDDDQSIYSWRGADIRNIHDFQKDFPEAKIIRLEQNYRSTSVILNAANDVIKNNSSRMEKTLWTAEDDGAPIYWIEGENEEEELIESIRLMKVHKVKNACDWTSFAFLYRSNHQSRIIEEQLREEGVPYQLVGGTKFFERKEVQDCIAYLRFAHNTNDEVSLHRIINYPRRGIGKGTILSLNEARKDYPKMTLFQTIENARAITTLSENTLLSLESFADLIERTQWMLKQADFVSTFKNVFEEIGFKQEIEKEEKNEKTREKRVNNYREFLFSMSRYQEKRSPKLGKFLEYLALFTDSDDFDNKKDQMTLMTVHASKGLEFDYVGLVGLTDDQFPNKRSLQDGGLEEERRLFYVAITRARKALSMSYPKTRFVYKKKETNVPSRFISEVNSKLFDTPPMGAVCEVRAEEKRQDARKNFFANLKKKAAESNK